MSGWDWIVAALFIPTVLGMVWLLIKVSDLLDGWSNRRNVRALDRLQEERRMNRAQFEEMAGFPLADWQWERLCAELPDLVREDT